MAQLDSSTVATATVAQHLSDHNQLHKKANYVFDVMDYGVTGDGSTDDTATIQAAVDAAEVLGGEVFFPLAASSYLMGTVTVGTSDGVTLNGGGSAVLTLTGASAGFRLVGTVSNCTVKGFIAAGDGTSDTGQAFLSNATGQTLKNIKALHNVITNIQLGIALTSESGGLIENIEYAHNHVETLQGTAGGQGYGLFLAGANDTSIYGNIHHNTIIDASRHSIYVSRGDDVIVAHNLIKDHRSTDKDASTRSAIEVSRGSRRAVIGNVFENTADGCIGIGPDDTASTQDILIANNILGPMANTVAQIHIGSSDPSAEGAISRVKVIGNIFTSGGSGGTNIEMWSGTNHTISDNLFVADGANSIVALAYDETAGTSTYSDEWEINNNRFVLANSAAAFRSNPPFTTAGVTVRFRGNVVTPGEAMFGQNAVLNGPIYHIVDNPQTGIIWDTGKEGIETSIVAFGDGDGTPSVLGGHVFKTANSAGKSITNFDQGNEGQVITVIVDDTNTTFTHGGSGLLFLNGAANFVATSKGTLTLVFDGTSWHEIGRSDLT